MHFKKHVKMSLASEMKRSKSRIASLARDSTRKRKHGMIMRTSMKPIKIFWQRTSRKVLRTRQS